MRYDLQTFRGDLFGGLTSTVVALPVALALGVASGMGAVAGLHGAIAVGFFAAVFGGTRSQISGPTAPMTVAMTVILTTHASNLTEALTVVVLGGLLQMLLGLAKVGRYVVYTPYVVVSGFMSGIGIIVILIQILPLLGSPPAPGGALGAVRVLPEALGALNGHALAVGLITLAAGVLWPRRLAKYLPGPLLSLIVGTLLGVLWLGGAPILGDVPAGLPGLKIGIPPAAFLLQALQPALILALLGSVDSLLTSLVADSLTGTRHNPNRELVGQGIGNMVSGVLGGLPGAGAMFLLLLAVGLGPVVEPVPHAVLAAIMIKVGWDIIDWPLVVRIHRIRREHLFVMLLTLGLTVFVDLVTAVAVGLIAAGMAHARRLERLELDSVVSVPLLDRAFFDQEQALPAADRYSARVGLVALKGTLTVASSSKLSSVVGGDIKDHEVVIFDFSEAVHLDDSAAMVVRRLVEVAAAEGTEVVVTGLSGSVATTLSTLDILRGIPEDRLTGSLDEARSVAHGLLNGRLGAGPSRQ